MSASGTDVVKMYSQAEKLRASGRLGEALERFRTLLHSLSDPIDQAYVSLGIVYCLREIGRLEEARQVIRKAAQKLPEPSITGLDLQFAEACVLWDERKYVEAQEFLDRILIQNAELLSSFEGKELYRDIQVKRGILLTALERFQEASQVLEEVLAIGLTEEQKADVLYNLGICHYHVSKFGPAKEKFVETLKAGVQEYWAIRAHYYLGLIHIREGSYAWAKQELEYTLPRANEASLSRKDILGALSTTCRMLGLNAEADGYSQSAKHE